MFGLTFEKLLLVALVAVCLVGPTRLPAAAAQLGRWTRRAREMVAVARTRVRDEVGPEIDDIDWRSLDPRQYDPRHIVRQALLAPTVVQAPPATPEELAAVPGYVPAASEAVDSEQAETVASILPTDQDVAASLPGSRPRAAVTPDR